MKFNKYEHENAYKFVSDEVMRDIEEVLRRLNTSSKADTRMLREQMLENLTKKGWSAQIRISTDAKITITSTLKEIGLCLQTGNMSRFYADLLKLQTLYCKNKIKAGVYIIPTKFESKRIGSNVAHFERFIDELKIFSKTLTIPLVVYGFERS